MTDQARVWLLAVRRRGQLVEVEVWRTRKLAQDRGRVLRDRDQTRTTSTTVDVRDVQDGDLEGPLRDRV